MSEIRNEEILEEEEQTKERAPFVVDDDDKAEWCLEQISKHKAEIEKWTAHYEAEKRRACMKHESDIVWLEAQLRGFFLQQNDNGLTRKTKTMLAYNLPHGKLVMKHQEPEYDKNEDKMVEWLRANAPEFIKVKETPDWAAMKKAFTFSGDRMVSVDEETGEIKEISGVRVVSREDIFKVEVK